MTAPSEPKAVRVYAAVRTAHLERFVDMTPATVLFQGTRYDFDTSLVGETTLVQVTRAGALRHLLRHRYDAVELNEPLMLHRWPDLVLQIAALRLRGILTRHRPHIGAYCIGYSDPTDELSARRVPPVLGRFVSRVVLRFLVSGMDRLAFGTQGSRDLLERYAGRRRVQSRAADFTAVPAPCSCVVDDDVRRDLRRILFLGAFDDRKGIRQTMAAWDVAHRAAPDLTLRLIGKGRLTDEVVGWADGRPEVTVSVDPPRADIHRALRESRVLVLLSQRVGAWREQVGLPVVEGLAHGCEVVTTDETGIARWLEQHGHTVVPSASSSPDVAAGAIVSAAASVRTAAEVLADLPSVDTRVAADRWLLQNPGPG